MDRHLIAVDGSPTSADQATIQRMLDDGRLLWLDMDAADPASRALLRDVFGVHPLALRAVAEFGQRPKIETYGDVTYLVMYGARGMGEPVIEVHCFYADDFLVTVRRDASATLDQLREAMTEQGGPLGGQAGRHPESDPAPADSRPASGQAPADSRPAPHRRAGRPAVRRPPRLVMLHHILESQIDSFFPALSDFDDRIDDLQQRIFTRPSDDELAELFSLQRWLVQLRKLVTPERDMIASLVSGVIVLPGKVPESEPYIRDLYDHLIRISDLIDSYRDLLSNAMDAYLSTVSNRLNQVMKQLTVIATVFLPLSFLTGFFGQNFGWMVSRLGGLPVFVGVGIGTEVIAVAALFVLFRRRGWM